MCEWVCRDQYGDVATRWVCTVNWQYRIVYCMVHNWQNGGFVLLILLCKYFSKDTLPWISQGYRGPQESFYITFESRKWSSYHILCGIGRCIQGTGGCCRSYAVLLISQFTLRYFSSFPWGKVPAPPGHPHTPLNLEGWRHWECNICPTSSLRVPVCLCRTKFIFVLLLFMSVFPSWPPAIQIAFQDSGKFPKKLPYTYCTVSIQNYTRSTPIINPWFQVTVSGSASPIKLWLVLIDPRR